MKQAHPSRSEAAKAREMSFIDWIPFLSVQIGF
jgi:hypothetical protein